MRKVKTPREHKGASYVNAHPTSTVEAINKLVPPRSNRNIRRGHIIKGMRNAGHIGWEAWEDVVVKLQVAAEKQNFDKANRFYDALKYAQSLLREVKKREEELQAINEEMEAGNEELQAANEEMEATNEELSSTSEELRQAGSYARSLIESSLDPLVTIGPDGKITDVNHETEVMTGHSREELIGTDFSDYFTDPENAMAGYQQVFKDGFVRDYPLDIRNIDGHVTPVLYNASVFRDENGNVQGVFAAARDITEQKRINEDLRLSSLYARSLIGASLDALVTKGPDGKIMDVNAEAESAIGRSREELIGTDFSDYFTNPENARAGYQQALKDGFVRNYPLDLRHVDGHVTPVLYNASVFRDEDGNIQGVFAAARDITEQKKTEQKLHKLLDELKGSQAQLMQAGKMSAVGTMTAGVAHELNNPMMSILNFIQYCIKHTPEDDRKYTVLKDAERETKRSSEIVNNLLTFSRMEAEGKEEYQQESLSEILDRVSKLLSYRLKKDNILLTQDIAEGTPAVWMKKNNIQQVVLNLINNAMDSVEKSKKKEVHVDIHREGECVQLTIADTGSGISSDTLDKIFDPFFTTKPVGHGTGLGLSISHSIVKAHGGELMVETEIGKGTKFKVLLPIEKRKEKTK